MNAYDSDAWVESFSLRAYRPMVRLASGCDRTYLEGSGWSHVARSYSRAQRRLLREYLRGLSSDFSRLHAISATRQPEPERACELFDSRLRFIFGVLWIEARLALQAVFPGSIDMEPLLEDVEDLARTTREMTRATLRLHVN